MNYGKNNDAKVYVEDVKEPHIVGLALAVPFFWVIIDGLVGNCIYTVTENYGYLYTFGVTAVFYICMFACTFSTAIIPDVFFTKDEEKVKWWIGDLVQCFLGSQICIGTLYFIKAATLYNVSLGRI